MSLTIIFRVLVLLLAVGVVLVACVAQYRADAAPRGIVMLLDDDGDLGLEPGEASALAEPMPGVDVPV